VGDKPQIDEDEDGEGDLFGDNLNQEGKKLKRMMRKRLNGQADDLFSESDSVGIAFRQCVRADQGQDEESPDAETVKADKDKDKEKDKEGQKSVPPSAERPSRPPSRGPTTGRGTSSPTGRRSNPLPTSGKASTAPPGSGSALLAQRAASRGASPHRSRQPSPLNRRATSPETGNGRTVSPATSAGGTSPPASGRATTPTSTAPAEPKQGKRKTTSESPFKDDPSSFAQKRKPSPSPSAPGGNRDRKKKKSAWTTPTPAGPDIAPFPGMITQSDVLAWFKRQGGVSVPMSVTISEFKQRIVDAGARKEDNQKLFLHWVGAVTVPEPGKRLRLKEGL